MQFSCKTKKLIQKVTKNRKQIKLTIGILHKGEQQFRLFDSDGETSYTSHLYEIGSITKVFTTSLFAKYLEKGAMHLDDSIAQYIPTFKDLNYYPTLKRLATHSAGYPTLYPMTRSDSRKAVMRMYFTRETVTLSDYLTMDAQKMTDLANHTKLQDKEYKWKYSNYGMALLGHAVAAVEDKEIWSLMNDYLINELELTNSFMGTDSSEILAGYDVKNREIPNWNWQNGANLASCAGAISSTAEDLLAFAKMNLDQVPSYLSLCHKKYTDGCKHFSMGLGWWIDKKNPDIFFHGGNTEGFSSMLAFDKKKNSAVVILANIQHFKEREALFMDILDNIPSNI